MDWRRVIALVVPFSVAFFVLGFVVGMEVWRGPDWRLKLDEYVEEYRLPDETVRVEQVRRALRPQNFTLLGNCHRLSRDGCIRTIGWSVLVSELALPRQRSTSFFHSRVACVRAMDFLARDTLALRRFRREIRRSSILATRGTLPNNQPPTFARLSSHNEPTLRVCPVDRPPPLPSLARGPFTPAARRNPRKGNACANELSRTDRGLARDDS